MKFLAANLLLNSPDPVTGRPRDPHEKLLAAVAWARWAEEVGFDGVGIGERHAAPFLASAPTVVLSHLAAITTRVRLVSTVTVLPLLDPVRVAEDFATIDHLSGGRVDVIIGKGNDPVQNWLFGYDLTDQWRLNRDKYELLRRLWREERVTWSGVFRPPLVEATTLPRPLQQPIPVWHGSASSTESTELAARFGEPLFSANAFHPTKKYTDLAAQHNDPEFTDVEDAIERGPLLVGSPEQVVDKLARWDEEFGGVEVLQIGIEGIGLPEEQQKASLELFLDRAAPVLRAELPSRVWTEVAA